MLEWVLIIQLTTSSQKIEMQSELACEAAKTALALKGASSACISTKTGEVNIWEK